MPAVLFTGDFTGEVILFAGRKNQARYTGNAEALNMAAEFLPQADRLIITIKEWHSPVSINLAELAHIEELQLRGSYNYPADTPPSVEFSNGHITEEGIALPVALRLARFSMFYCHLLLPEPDLCQHIFGNTTDVNIRMCQCDNWESLTASFSNCRSIMIVESDLEEIPSGISSATELSLLALYSNKIKHVPQWLDHLEQLAELNLTQNQISSVEPAFRHLLSFNNGKLDLSYNSLTTFPGFLATLPGIAILTGDRGSGRDGYDQYRTSGGQMPTGETSDEGRTNLCGNPLGDFRPSYLNWETFSV